MLNTMKARRSLLSGARGEGESPRPHPCQAGRAPGAGRGNARGPGVRGSWSLEPQLGGAEIRGDIAGSRRPLAAPWQSGGQRGGRLRGLVALGQVPPSQRWGRAAWGEAGVEDVEETPPRTPSCPFLSALPLFLRFSFLPSPSLPLFPPFPHPLSSLPLPLPSLPRVLRPPPFPPPRGSASARRLGS